MRCLRGFEDMWLKTVCVRWEKIDLLTSGSQEAELCFKVLRSSRRFHARIRILQQGEIFLRGLDSRDEDSGRRCPHNRKNFLDALKIMRKNEMFP